MENKKGKFIVFYGINNLGKTTQARMLAQRLSQCGYKAEYLKYAVYDLEPAGKLINGILRNGNPYGFSAREKQLLHYIDRISFEPMLKNKLEKGINVVAEDYFGTAVAWGIAAGVDEGLLKYFYSFVYPEDLAILFDGERFKSGIETGHYYESNEILTGKARTAHLKIGAEYNWRRINANLSSAEIHEILWREAVNLIERPANYFVAPNFKELHDQLYMAEKETARRDAFADYFYEAKARKTADKIIIQRLSPIARLPQKSFSRDSEFNLYASDFCSIPPRSRAIIKTGLKIYLPIGYIGMVTKTDEIDENKLHVLISTINYKNNKEVVINIINLGNDICHISPGDKIAQLTVQKAESLEIMVNES